MFPINRKKSKILLISFQVNLKLAETEENLKEALVKISSLEEQVKNLLSQKKKLSDEVAALRAELVESSQGSSEIIPETQTCALPKPSTSLRERDLNVPGAFNSRSVKDSNNKRSHSTIQTVPDSRPLSAKKRKVPEGENLTLSRTENSSNLAGNYSTNPSSIGGYEVNKDILPFVRKNLRNLPKSGPVRSNASGDSIATTALSTTFLTSSTTSSRRGGKHSSDDNHQCRQQ